MSTISKPKTFTSGTTIVSADVNSDFDTIYNDYNGNITNANVASGAAITASKLNLATIAQTIGMSGVADNWAQGADIASATSTPIGAATGNFIHVTGTTTITSFDTVQAGTIRAVEFTGILTLTYSATALILPTSANITTAAGDTAIFVSEGSGNWRCLAYQTLSGAPLVAATAATALSGSVIQIANTVTGATASGSTAIPQDDTIPQKTEGDQFMSLSITPHNSSNNLKIDIVFNAVFSSQNGTVALFQDSTSNALAVGTMGVTGTSTIMGNCTFSWYMAAGTTSSTTFYVRAGSGSGTTYFNGGSSGRQFGGVLASSITITEFKA